MNTTLERLERLEGRYERFLLAFQQAQQQINALLNQSQALQAQQGGGTGPSSSCSFYYIAPTAISAGSSATNQTVYALQGGSVVIVTTTATVYHVAGGATRATAGKIFVEPCGDGTWGVIDQACS